MLKIKAREVSKLTPQVIGHAEEVARDPLRSRQPLEDLQLSSHQWAGHVSQLIEATQKANYPWSKTAERLVSAAKTGEGLEAQVRSCCLKSHTVYFASFLDLFFNRRST